MARRKYFPCVSINTVNTGGGGTRLGVHHNLIKGLKVSVIANLPNSPVLLSASECAGDHAGTATR